MLCISSDMLVSQAHDNGSDAVVHCVHRSSRSGTKLSSQSVQLGSLPGKQQLALPLWPPLRMREMTQRLAPSPPNHSRKKERSQKALPSQVDVCRLL